MTNPTWLTPYFEVWEEAMGKGSCPAPALSQQLRPLTAHWPEDEIVARLRAYLKDAGKYASPARFRQTFGQWASAPEQRAAPVVANGWWTEEFDAATRPRG